MLAAPAATAVYAAGWKPGAGPYVRCVPVPAASLFRPKTNGTIVLVSVGAVPNLKVSPVPRPRLAVPLAGARTSVPRAVRVTVPPRVNVAAGAPGAPRLIVPFR